MGSKMTNKRTKGVKFEVVYKTFNLISLEYVVVNFDLGISGLSPLTEIWTWTTSTKIDKKYILEAILTIEKAIKSIGGRVIKIKHIK